MFYFQKVFLLSQDGSPLGEGVLVDFSSIRRCSYRHVHRQTTVCEIQRIEEQDKALWERTQTWRRCMEIGTLYYRIFKCWAICMWCESWFQRIGEKPNQDTCEVRWSYFFFKGITTLGRKQNPQGGREGLVNGTRTNAYCTCTITYCSYFIQCGTIACCY